ncbi:Uncharacterised protein [Buttiauxella agrestis]|uniref:Uncharacterized protein n=1 Tax=Buttiauxella agrestis TaxID=82977 RepID=A0A381C3W3_9ENTR|nr:hypothetical protein [Buttiauxella agrestis]SUW62580.1 Uncharacterised protein [Buttiauxella agrestis]
MSGIRELSFDEIALVSGGSANGQDAGERSNYGNNNARTSYGGQANGFQPNYAASGHGLLDGVSRDCLTSMAIGTANVVAAGASRSITGFGTAAASALNDIGKTCNDNNSRSGPPFH